MQVQNKTAGAAGATLFLIIVLGTPTVGDCSAGARERSRARLFNPPSFNTIWYQ